MDKTRLDGQKYLGERWESFVREILNHTPSKGWADHIIVVCDTVEMCMRWFDSHGVSYTAADLVAMAGMIIARQEREENVRGSEN